MYIFIVNPVAGDGKSKRLFNKISSSKYYKEIKSEIYFTAYEGHGKKIAEHILTIYDYRDIKALIVIGGDGTIHEVVNGLGENRIPLAVIPGGSGNDFARGIGMFGDPMEVFQKILKQDTSIPYWLGTFKTEEMVKYFANSIGFGFDAEILEIANKSKMKRILNKLYSGHLVYIFALIQVLFHFKPRTILIDIDGESHTFTECWMVTITNHPYYGGGMKIIPKATNQSENYSMLIIQNISRWKVLTLFMTIFIGKQTLFKGVTVLKAKSITIQTSVPISFQVDGKSGESRFCQIHKDNHPIYILDD